MDKKKKLSKTTPSTDSKDVAGILMAISVVAKRLSKSVTESDQKKSCDTGGDEDATENS